MAGNRQRWKLTGRAAGILLAGILTASQGLNVFAAPHSMSDGRTFDADYYAKAYPDVVKVFGKDAKALYQHYENNGRAENRLPFDPSLVAGEWSTLPEGDLSSLRSLMRSGHWNTTFAEDGNVISMTDVVVCSDGREMLPLINQMRLGLDGTNWYTAEDGSKVSVNGLSPLSYSTTLEKIAIERAMEAALMYKTGLGLTHTRPSGGTVATNATKLGENLTCAPGVVAMAYTPEMAFTAFSEASQPYSGQGHRRNMLDANVPYTSVGIGHVSTPWGDFWAQEFAPSFAHPEKFTYPNSESSAYPFDTPVTGYVMK